MMTYTVGNVVQDAHDAVAVSAPRMSHDESATGSRLQAHRCEGCETEASHTDVKCGKMQVSQTGVRDEKKHPSIAHRCER